MLDIGCVTVSVIFFFQAEDGIRDLVRSRGLGDVYKRQDCIQGANERSACGRMQVVSGFDRRGLSEWPIRELSLIHI